MFNYCSKWQVVVNKEKQFSIWPLTRDLPSGWTSVSKEGTKDECLRYIGEKWTNMCPYTLQKDLN